MKNEKKYNLILVILEFFGNVIDFVGYIIFFIPAQLIKLLEGDTDLKLLKKEFKYVSTFIEIERVFKVIEIYYSPFDAIATENREYMTNYFTNFLKLNGESKLEGVYYSRIITTTDGLKFVYFSILSPTYQRRFCYFQEVTELPNPNERDFIDILESYCISYLLRNKREISTIEVLKELGLANYDKNIKSNTLNLKM